MGPINDVRKFFMLGRKNKVVIDNIANMNTYSSSINGVVLNTLDPRLYMDIIGEVMVLTPIIVEGPPIEDSGEDNE